MTNNYKKGKLIQIVQEFDNEGDKYLINGIDTSHAILFARKKQGQYEPIPLGNYTITQEENNQYLNITNKEYLATIERVQIGIEFSSISSDYDVEFNVDINILKDKYNQLVEDVKNIFKYVKTSNMIADGLDVDVVLPQLDTDEVWVKTENGYRGFNIGSLEANIQSMINQFKALVESSKVELGKEKDKLILEIKGQFDKEIEAGKQAITQKSNEEVGVLTDLADSKISEITQEGNKQKGVVNQQGNIEVERIKATGIDIKLDKGTYQGNAQNLKDEIDKKLSKTGGTVTGKVNFNITGTSMEFYNNGVSSGAIGVAQTAFALYNPISKATFNMNNDGTFRLDAKNMPTVSKEVGGAINELSNYIIGDSGIPQIRFIQNAGLKIKGEGYIDKTTGKLYIALADNNDTSVSSNFGLATNIENTKRHIKDGETNFAVIAGGGFDQGNPTIACKKIGRIGVIECVNAQLSRGQSFSLPSWFKPYFNTTYGSIVEESAERTVEVIVNKTTVVFYPSTSVNGATGQIVVLLEEV